MQAMLSHSPTVLHDYPPAEKPDRLPLRQGWRTTGDEPAAFEQQPQAAWLFGAPRFAVTTEGREGEVRAINEKVLKEARGRIQQAHANAVLFEPPAVCTWVDEGRGVEMEPLMSIRLNARRVHHQMLVDELRSRDARLQEVELQKHHAVIRGEAPLAAILGLEDAVMEATGDTTLVVIWLARYQPVGAWNGQGGG